LVLHQLALVEQKWFGVSDEDIRLLLYDRAGQGSNALQTGA